MTRLDLDMSERVLSVVYWMQLDPEMGSVYDFSKVLPASRWSRYDCESSLWVATLGFAPRNLYALALYPEP